MSGGPIPKELRSRGGNPSALLDGIIQAMRPPLLHVQDEKAQNTDSGTFTSGDWRTRDLNTVKTNEITGASLTGNQITLPAGIYEVDGSAPAILVDRHQTRLRDITNSADLLIGTSEFSRSTAGERDGTNRSFCTDRFTLTGETLIELQHQCETTLANNGFGVQANFTTEVYAVLKIWKLD